MNLIILGNAGPGKSTMARRLIGDRDIACLSLDDIAGSLTSSPGPRGNTTT